METQKETLQQLKNIIKQHVFDRRSDTKEAHRRFKIYEEYAKDHKHYYNWSWKELESLYGDYKWKCGSCKARDHLLAYGFLRGVAYERMEPHTDPNEQNWEIVSRAKRVYRIYNEYYREDNSVPRLSEADVLSILKREGTSNGT